MTFELKPFHRVTLRNGEKYIVVPREAAATTFYSIRKFALANIDGWLWPQFDDDLLQGRQWDIVKVLDVPRDFGSAINVSAHGEVLWDEEDESLAALIAQRDALNEEISRREVLRG